MVGGTDPVLTSIPNGDDLPPSEFSITNPHGPGCTNTIDTRNTAGPRPTMSAPEILRLPPGVFMMSASLTVLAETR